MNTAKKIIGFQNDSVNGYVQIFLSKLERKSNDTRKNYECWINDFFMYVFGDTCNIGWDQVFAINNKRVETYVDYLLKNKKNSGNTINQKIAGIRSLFKYLRKDHPQISETAFDIEQLDTDVAPYDPLTQDEYEGLLQFCLNNERNLRIEKALYFEACYITALRRNAMLNLKWNEITQRKNPSGEELVWTIQTKDKRNKKDIIAISGKFYNKLLKIKPKTMAEDTRVFNISDRALYACLKRYCEFANIDTTQRKISIHSIKKTSGNVAWSKTKNIKQVQKHMHHSTAQTTMDSYITEEDNLINQISFQMDEEVDISALDNYSPEQIVNALKKCSKTTILQIINNLEP